MMEGKKYVMGFLLVLCMALFLCFTMPCGLPAAEKPIRVGLIDVYSGAGAAFGKQALAGWQMAVDEFNSKGGLKGRKIEIITRDDKFKPDEGLSHARELLLKENVDFLGGTTNSAVTLAISEFVKSKKKLFMVSISRSHRITGEKGHRYIFRGCPSADLECLAGGTYAASKPFKNYYIIGEDYEYGHSIAENFWKGLSKNKKDAVKAGEAWCKLGETDYTSYLTALMAKKPDAVCLAFGASGLIPFVKQGKLFGLFEQVPCFAFGLGDSIFPKALKDDMPTGLYGGSNYLWYYPETEANKAFVAKCNQQFNDPHPSGIGIFGGYSSGKFLCDAVLKAGSTETEKVIKALEGLKIETVVGPIAMRACDHQAVTATFWGKLDKVAGYPFPILTDIVATPADKVMPSCKDIEEARKSAK
jgi:branched-chain amino acid transport system substrate-binding protein